MKQKSPNSYYDEMKNSQYYLMDFDRNNYDNYNLLVNQGNWNFFRKILDPLRENFNENFKLNLLYKATWSGFGHNEFKNRARYNILFYFCCCLFKFDFEVSCL